MLVNLVCQGMVEFDSDKLISEVYDTFHFSLTIQTFPEDTQLGTDFFMWGVSLAPCVLLALGRAIEDVTARFALAKKTTYRRCGARAPRVAAVVCVIKVLVEVRERILAKPPICWNIFLRPFLQQVRRKGASN